MDTPTCSTQHNWTMDSQELTRKREKEEVPEQEKSRKDKVSSPSPSPPPPTPPLPPSSTSSPSHEFSFTISLHPCSNSTPTTIKSGKTPPDFDIDLAPADEIFFHGQLLPLHLLSHPSFSPRPSDISIEELNLPIKHIYSEHSPRFRNDTNAAETKERTKPKPFSSLFGFKKWKKGSNVGEREEKSKNKKAFDVSRFLKKYASMVLLFKREKEKRDLRRRPYSFSGNLNPKERDGWKKRRGELSMPTSMRTSPTNSGLLLTTPAAFSSSDESTMEELQSAIQAAIAHCKNSVAIKEDTCNS